MNAAARGKVDRVQREQERKLLRRHCCHCHERKPQRGGFYLARGNEGFVCRECWPGLVREVLELIKRREQQRQAEEGP